MKFLTMQNPPAQGKGATGDGFRRIIKRITNKDGSIEYKETGKVNVYAQIQEGKEDTMIYNILERFKNGDLGVLYKKPALNYGDSTIAPNNINDLNAMAKNAGQKYQAMPEELKAKIISGEQITQQDILKAYKIEQPKQQEVKDGE